MCGRFVLKKLATLTQKYQVAYDWMPSFNISPGQDALVVTNQLPTQGQLFRWGLVPSWSKDGGSGSKLFNARAETIHEKPSFREAFARKRCLVFADGFYEWQKVGKGKQPHFIRVRQEQPFAMEGIWESWQQNDSHKPLHTFSIITTEANTLVKNIHDRMPVILPEEKMAHWLSDSLSARDAFNLLKPYDADAMEIYPVSDRVNAIRNNDAQLIDREKLPETAVQLNLFE